MERNLLIGVAVFSLLGFINASYLFLTSYYGESPVCNFTSGCDVVAASPHSKIFGVPLSLLGAFFYLISIGFASWALSARDPLQRYYILAVSLLGAASSVYFLYLQAFVIQAWCEYCLFSAFVTFVLLALSSWYFLINRPLREALQELQ